jgi:hypothetical protein
MQEENARAGQTPDEVRARLAAIDDESLRGADLHKLYVLFREAGSVEGLARVAPLFRHHHPNDLVMRLHGVDAHVRAGEKEAAVRELGQLEAMDGAAAKLPDFVRQYVSLGRPDLAAAFGERLLDDPARPVGERVQLGFQIAEAFRTRQMRPQLFRILMKLAAFCHDDFAQSRKVADLMISIDEIFGAAKVMEAARAGSPAEARLKAAYQVFGRSGKVTAEEVERAEQLLAEPEGEFDYWFMLGERVEPFVGRKRAAEASRRAVAAATSAEERLQARAQLLGHLGWLGDVAAMRGVLREIPIDEIVAARKAFQFAGLAGRAGDHRRAVAICQAWQRAEPASPQPSMLLSRLHAGAEETREAEAAMDATLEALAGQPKQARNFYNETIKLARQLGYPFEKRAVDLALAAFPDDPDLRALAARDEFASKFFRPDAPPPRRKGILARLGLARGS